MSRRVRWFGLFVLLAAGSLALACPAARAEEAERITDFDSRIEIYPDGHLRVSETIVVTCAVRQIKHGIFRDFPTDYRDRMGNRVRVAFDVVSVQRDGTAEPFVVLPMANGARIRIGDAHRVLKPGTYAYTIVYRTDRQLGFFEAYDELYWNVTGNGWIFPIARARVTVVLPPGAEVLQHAAYTGPTGATGQDFVYDRDADGNPVFVTTRALNPGWGLTVAVAWPKGIVAEPSTADRAGWFLRDNRASATAGGGLLALFVYYLFSWHRVGRDPPAGTIIPRFDPPRSLSAAAVHYVYRMGAAGFGSKALAVALVQMAVKGWLKIEQHQRNRYVLHRVPGAQSSLGGWEAALLAHLFAGGDRIELDRRNHRQIGGALALLRKALRQQLGVRFFFHNHGYFLFGMGLTVLLALVVLKIGITPLAGAILVILVIVNLVFQKLLRAPTVAGRRLMDEIEGFRQYLSVAEQDRLDRLNPPEKTPELFERFLPYAMALDVENQWGEQFAEVLDVNHPDPQRRYRPGWYTGDAPLGSLGANVGASLGESFSQAISASATPPGSSSGSSGGGGGGGGGSSGGGGGGGGGGGW